MKPTNQSTRHRSHTANRQLALIRAMLSGTLLTCEIMSQLQSRCTRCDSPDESGESNGSYRQTPAPSGNRTLPVSFPGYDPD